MGSTDHDNSPHPHPGPPLEGTRTYLKIVVLVHLSFYNRIDAATER
jgi:hypothetical protein